MHTKFVSGKYNGNPSQVDPAGNPNRTEALNLLRAQGYLTEKTRVKSAEWNKESKTWLIILKHPTGPETHWVVDVAAKDCRGGPCTQ